MSRNPPLLIPKSFLNLFPPYWLDFSIDNANKRRGEEAKRRIAKSGLSEPCIMVISLILQLFRYVKKN